MNKKERTEYIISIINEDIEFDKEKEELVLGFILNILTNNTVMNRYEWSSYGNLKTDKKVKLTDCINYIGLKLNLKEKQG